MKAKTNFLRCIGYLSFTKDRIRLDLLLILVLVLPLNFLNYELHVLLLSYLMSEDTVRRCYETSNKNWFCPIKNSAEVLSTVA